MAETKYSFNKQCDTQRLTKEIQESAIITALDRIEGSTSIVDVWFKYSLSETDEQLLTDIVNAHVNEPLPDDITIKADVVSDSPFSSKNILINGQTKKLYKRQHGQQATLVAGSNDILFTIPYPWVKITGVRLINGEALDYCSFFVTDSVAGTYSGVPNYVLNQFGFSVNIASGDHEEHCKYDADLYYGMQVKLVYNSLSAKTIGVNYVIHEVSN